MALAIEWDNVGERIYKAGIDRGVLYRGIESDDGVPWNGLVSVEDNTTYELTSYYQDGIRMLNHVTPGNFEGRLTAITYPTEFDRMITGAQFAGEEKGLAYYNQEHAPPFHLTYRRKIMNDLGEELGYEIHILYGLTAAPEAQVYETLTEEGIAPVFSWQLSGVPEHQLSAVYEVPEGFGVRPTSHISIDSRTCDPTKLQTVENNLYGRVGIMPEIDPQMLSLTTLRYIFGDLVLA